MIAYLRGPVTYRQPPELIVEAGGVGYRVLASMATFDGLPQDDSEVVLPTLLVVRENAHTLFGFADEAERQRFSQLMRISGIGAKTALAVLSALPGATLRQHVEAGNLDGLTQVPGIGEKTAQRLLVELQHMVLKAEDTEIAGAATPQYEAQQGLGRLGWKPAEARRMIGAIETQGLGAEDIIREALRGSVR
ncbi:MAG: Holliday junction branch migration protein RuvA [Gammaproteobacteria bacterium]|nr:Holliday junction branch migration protein RuvA [Gammaproteobacteria bacterium]